MSMSSVLLGRVMRRWEGGNSVIETCLYPSFAEEEEEAALDSPGASCLTVMRNALKKKNRRLR